MRGIPMNLLYFHTIQNRYCILNKIRIKINSTLSLRTRLDKKKKLRLFQGLGLGNA